MSCGFDAGTYNIVTCKRNEKGDLVYKREVNAFLEMPLENEFVFNMMKKSGVPLILREDAKIAYALGEAAVNIAYTMSQISLRRPMQDGCVNPKEKDAFQIMNIMMHSLLDNIDHDKEIMYYSVPANAVNQETDADYHRKILDAIFKAYKSEQGYTVDARPINEGMAVVYSELANKYWTGLGVSCGSGMVNVAFALYGVEVFSFSLVNSGDWIDKQAAKATGESIAFINKEKHKINLTKPPTTLVERAIRTQYELMIERTVAGIKKGLMENEEKIRRLDNPIDVIVAGGSASPPGFDALFKNLLLNAQIPVNFGEIIRPDDPLYCVSRGCLIAAENATK
jgi:actin-like ATPase involved in cell morphogenesis